MSNVRKLRHKKRHNW